MLRTTMIALLALVFGLMPIVGQFAMASASECEHGISVHELEGTTSQARLDCGDHHQKQQMPCNMGGKCTSTGCTPFFSAGTAVATFWTLPGLEFVIPPSRAPQGQHLAPLEEPPRQAA